MSKEVFAIVPANHIFVFGSNLAGRHGKGAALAAALRYGAEFGKGEGLMGRSYALPTKDSNVITLSLQEVRTNIATFLQVAKENLTKDFHVTRVGCGLAGYNDEDIAPLFAELQPPVNCFFHPDWKKWGLRSYE